MRQEVPRAAWDWLGERGSSHPFDVGAAEAAGLNRIDATGLRQAAGSVSVELARRYGADPASWRRPRRLYDVEVQGLAPQPRLEFYDRGTWQQAVALGP